MTIKIFYDSIVIHNGELVVRKVYGEKIIVFFVAGVIRIFFFQIISYQCCGGGAMVTVGYVGCRHLTEFINDLFDDLLIIHNPKPVNDSVIGSKVVFRFWFFYVGDKIIQFGSSRISKEYRLRIHHGNMNMFFPVCFLIWPGEFMFLDLVIHVIFNSSTGNDAILRAAIHNQFIDVERISFVLEENSILYQFLKILLASFVDFRCVVINILR